MSDITPVLTPPNDEAKAESHLTPSAQAAQADDPATAVNPVVAPRPGDFLLTKVIATVGPASLQPGVLNQLIDEGARVFRINFSHGKTDGFAATLQAVREASRQTGVPVGVLGDISGPKIRVGQVCDGGIQLEPGQVVEFQLDPIVAQRPSGDADPVVFSTTYAGFIGDVKPGDRALIDDGAVRLLVTDRVGEGDACRVRCTVTVGGLVTSSKGINLPDSEVSAPSLTAHDERCVDWALENGVDFLALSFVRSREDVRKLRARIAAARPNQPAPPIIAKIEKPQAVDDLDAIMSEADGVMVARGDLGVEMDLAKVPIVQKRIIKLAHDYGKPVIVATQMLQSMIEAAVPTRAEVSDVANAIYDGADAVMLSGETAVGKYPVQAVHIMGWIVRVTQQELAGPEHMQATPPRKFVESRYRTAALAHGVNTVVRDVGAKLMAIWSQHGGGARYLSQNRPTIPIIAASSDPAVLRRMSLMFGVTPVLMDAPASLEAFSQQIDNLILERGWAQQGDFIVTVGGEPIGAPGVTNTLSIRTLGGVCKVE